MFDGFYIGDSSEFREFKYAQYDIEEASIDDYVAGTYENYSKADWSALKMKYINFYKDPSLYVFTNSIIFISCIFITIAINTFI